MTRVRLRVLVGEWVVARGTHRVAWHVHDGKRWLHVRNVAGAAEERVSPGPGTIWSSLFEFAAEPGCWLLRVDTTPLEERPRDPLAYLESGRRNPGHHISRRYYRAASDGRVLTARKEDAPK
jgi:hypothetical protein